MSFHLDIFHRTRAMTILPRAPEGGALALAPYAGVLLVVYWLTWVIYSRRFHALAKVPGPVWASVSRTWLMYRMYRGDYQLAQLALHKK